MSTLVIYFSQTGTTKAAAEKIAVVKKAELIQIKSKSLIRCLTGKP